MHPIAEYASIGVIANDKVYMFRPKEDITTYELSICMILINRAATSRVKDDINSIFNHIMTDSILRHFEIIDNGTYISIDSWVM